MDASDLDFSLANLFGVHGKVALVTEGCSGTGVATAAALVQNGAKVYIASVVEADLQKVGHLRRTETYFFVHLQAETYVDTARAERKWVREM